jgi:transposase InsO family protein
MYSCVDNDRTATRNPAPGVVFHSDRGCQYTSHDYAELAEDLDIRLSIGRTGQCWDNALAESIFASLKGECLNAQPYPRRSPPRDRRLHRLVQRHQTHSSLGYRSPDEYEATANRKELPQAPGRVINPVRQNGVVPIGPPGDNRNSAEPRTDGGRSG